MGTRVEELRERLVDAELDSGSVGTEREAEDIIDALIAIAQEKERERILKLCEGWAHGGHFGLLWLGKHELKEAAYIIFNPSVFTAPDEEDGRHKMAEELTKSIDKIMIEAINFRPKEAKHD